MVFLYVVMDYELAVLRPSLSFQVNRGLLVVSSRMPERMAQSLRMNVNHFFH